MTAVRGARVAWAAAVATGSVLAVAATAHQIVNLRSLRGPHPGPAQVHEPVSVLLPARDEAHRIAPTVRALREQTGVTDLQILVLDDGSTDGTADVVRAACGDDDRWEVVPGRPLPPGWVGKPHACAQLAARARGRVLVVVDADVVLAPHAIAAAVTLLRAPERPLDLLCPWPRQLADGPAGRLLQPLQVWSWSVLLPLRLSERAHRPSLVAANGQFLLVDAAALARAGGFARVAGEVLDDIALARAVTGSGGRAGVADGSALASCRMYDGWTDLSAGYRKSLWSAFGTPGGAAAVSAMLALVYLLPPLAALHGSRAGLAGYLAAVASRALAAGRTGGRVWPDVLAHPLSVAGTIGLIARSVAGHRRGTLIWKGRTL